MNLSMLLEMAAQGAGDRIALGSRNGGTTYAEMLDRTRATAAWLDDLDRPNVGILDQNSEAIPLLLFGAGMSGRVFAPLNYRLAPEALASILERLAPATIVTGDDIALPGGATGDLVAVDRSEYLVATTGSRRHRGVVVHLGDDRGPERCRPASSPSGHLHHLDRRVPRIG
jgi:acyl-CoA synthetase (AMP-forming)/AMP-acid ligase II